MNLKNKNYMFFDMDGLLIDTETLFYTTRKETLNKYGFPFSKADQAKYIARGFPDTIKKLKKLVGDANLGQKIFDESMDLFREKLISGQIQLMDGTLELLQFLQTNNKHCYITSSSTKEIIMQTAKTSGIAQYFDGFISGDEVKNNKPAPDIYLHALKISGAAKEESLVFEDAPSGIISGSSAGIDVIAVPDLIQPDKEVRSKAFKVLNNLSEVIPYFN